jgi:FkbM family methyltransferase
MPPALHTVDPAQHVAHTPHPAARFISSALILFSGGKAKVSDMMTIPALTYGSLGQKYRGLPVIDIGAHNGLDYTIPAALLGHRVYSFEPTPSKYANIVAGMGRHRNITHYTSPLRFHAAPPGSVLLRPATAASNRSGYQNFTITSALDGVGNSLVAGALPGYMKKNSEQVEVELVTLDDVLRHEHHGVYLLKIDSQGHEYHILQGCQQYMRTHPVYMIFFEYYPKGLLAHGTDPITLLEFMRHRGYTCFNIRDSPVGALSFEEFVAKYPATDHGWGKFTDLACIRLDLL